MTNLVQWFADGKWEFPLIFRSVCRVLRFESCRRCNFELNGLLGFDMIGKKAVEPKIIETYWNSQRLGQVFASIVVDLGHSGSNMFLPGWHHWRWPNWKSCCKDLQQWNHGSSLFVLNFSGWIGYQDVAKRAQVLSRTEPVRWPP